MFLFERHLALALNMRRAQNEWRPVLAAPIEKKVFLVSAQTQVVLPSPKTCFLFLECVVSPLFPALFLSCTLVLTVLKGLRQILTREGAGA